MKTWGLSREDTLNAVGHDIRDTLLAFERERLARGQDADTAWRGSLADFRRYIAMADAGSGGRAAEVGT